MKLLIDVIIKKNVNESTTITLPDTASVAMLKNLVMQKFQGLKPDGFIMRSKGSDGKLGPEMDQFEKRLREYNVVEGTKILVIVKIYGEASVESETYEDDIPDTKELATRFGVKEEDIKMYIDDFNSFDTNKSGKITVTELKRGMAKRGINMTLEQVKKMVQVTDQNHDDSVEMM